MPNDAAATFASLIHDGLLEIGDGYRAKLDELGGAGIAFLRAGSMADSGFNWADCDHFHDGLTPKLAPKRGYASDTVVTTKGNSVGRTGFVPSAAPDFVYSPHLSYWRSCDPARLDPRFLYFWSRSSEFVDQLNALSHSTDMAPYLSLQDQKRLRMTLPSPESQRAIGELLGALDDKIAVNDRIATTSGQLALSYGERTLGTGDSHDAELGHHVEVTKGVSYRSADVGYGDDWLVTLKCVGRDRTFQSVGMKVFSGAYKPSQAVRPGEIVVAQTDLTQKAEVLGRPVRVIDLDATGNYVASLDLCVVRPGPSLTPETLYSLLATDRFHDHAVAHCNGTTVLHLSARAIPSYMFHLPSYADISVATAIMKPLFERSDHARRESRALEALRDTLLPKLISGELRIKDAERLVSAAV